ncbi:uncharacterized protein [Diadema setosum]|uniref:uncharacterized protein n=1 Tax=Diadema setosum TaxID=31175 RepID=UPI003B3BA898
MTTKWNNSKPGPKTWVHSAAALTSGHVVYNVKYLGNVETEGPKGADIVKEAVTKLKFNKQVKRSEGTKPPKRELTISVDGVTIQEKQTKEKQFSYPLHHISYCADDKSDKKICAFIAKDVRENKHLCHVMESDKNAEEITLTVGQAFDLAYQKFLSSGNKSQEQQQQNDTLRKRLEDLEVENKRLKMRVVELELEQGLTPSYSLEANGEQEKSPIGSAKFNPFNTAAETNGSASDISKTEVHFFPSFTESVQSPTSPTSESFTAVNLLADLNTLNQPSDPSQTASMTSGGTLAEQAAAYQAGKPGGVFDDTFAPPAAAKPIEPLLLPPPPPAPPRNVAPLSPVVSPSPVQSPAEPMSPVPPSPTVNGAQTAVPGIARSRPRPSTSQGAGVIAPPPRTVRRGDSFGAMSPSATSPAPNIGLDDLYAAVSKAAVSDKSGTGTVTTTSPNPFSPPAPTTEFSFDILSNKGSNMAPTTNNSSSNDFSIMDLDPLK